MRIRSNARFVLLAAPLLAYSIASASERRTCPAGRNGEDALTTVGGRSFAPVAGGSRETPVTSYCLGCHDGSVSTPVLIGGSFGARTAAGLAWATPSSVDGSAMHPVDVFYPDGRPGFRPASEVELVLPLSGGRVTCETCHSGGESNRARLTLSNEGSRLCLTCHEK